MLLPLLTAAATVLTLLSCGQFLTAAAAAVAPAAVAPPRIYIYIYIKWAHRMGGGSRYDAEQMVELHTRDITNCGLGRHELESRRVLIADEP